MTATGFSCFDDYCGAGTADGRLCRRMRPLDAPPAWRCHDHR